MTHRETGFPAWTLALFLTPHLFLVSTGQAQLVRSVISGTLTDPAAAGIPAANVTITNTALGVSRTEKTNEFGLFRFAAVENGSYTVSFAAPGLKQLQIDNVDVRTEHEVVINRSLAIGTIAAEISVEALGLEIARATPTIERTLSAQAISDLPVQIYNGT